jgi:hypothetical protein
MVNRSMIVSSIQVYNPAYLRSRKIDHKAPTGKKIISVAIGSSRDVDLAVDAAKKVGVHSRTHYYEAQSLTFSSEGIQNFLGFKMPWNTARKAAVQAGGLD